MVLGRIAVVFGVVLAAAGTSASEGARLSRPGAILYSHPGSEDDQCGSIWSVDPSTGVSSAMDMGFAASCDPDWSADARHIVFSGRLGEGGLRIYVADASGRNAVALSHPPTGSNDYMPAWSPDGMRIVFERGSARGNFNLVIVDGDGTNERQLTHGHGFDGTPGWSPDGRILFASDRLHARRGCKDCSALYVMRPNDGHVSRITRRRYNALMPSWSRNGTSIAWARAPSIYAVLSLYVMRSDTRQARRVDLQGESPAWSPDSRTIVYSSRGGLVLIGVDGSGRRQLTRTDGGSGPSWRPVSGGS